MFAQISQQTTTESETKEIRPVTRNVSSLNELIGFKPTQVENEQDFDRIIDGKKDFSFRRL
ncbi:hypothetical protein LEP1GSC170_3397 [Leptospira interrogans serovar Bataviae str. HAI135]|nr:hypothetical protein LEP1GSC170_3397 [Leptospira interrogans serovar Bataviae str. HAI135]